MARYEYDAIQDITITDEFDRVVGVITKDKVLLRDGYKIQLDVGLLEHNQGYEDWMHKVVGSDTARDVKIGKAIQKALNTSKQHDGETAIIIDAAICYGGDVKLNKATTYGGLVKSIDGLLEWANKEGEK